MPGDTFVENVSDTLLQSHTPTGPNPGTAWTNSSAGQVLVKVTANVIEESDFSNSNQFCLNDDLGSDEMDVQLDITRIVAAGVRGVRTRTSTADAQGWEYSYDEDNTWWHIDDGTNVANFVEAWPGGTVTIQAQQRKGVGRLYVNGVLKVTLSSNLLSGRTRAGITLSNFTVAGPHHRADNFFAVAARDPDPTSYAKFPKNKLRYDLPEEVRI